MPHLCNGEQAMKDHLITHRYYGSCRMLPDHPVGNEAHFVGTTVYCLTHCPTCNEPARPVLSESAPLAGEQQELPVAQADGFSIDNTPFDSPEVSE